MREWYLIFCVPEVSKNYSKIRITVLWVSTSLHVAISFINPINIQEDQKKNNE